MYFGIILTRLFLILVNHGRVLKAVTSSFLPWTNWHRYSSSSAFGTMR